MKIAFIVDGRAQHAHRWIRYFAEQGHEVLVLSTYPCSWNESGIRLRVLPGAFRPGSAFVKQTNLQTGTVDRIGRYLIRKGLDNLVRPLWHRLNAADALWQGYAARRYLRDFRPNLVHSMRIQNEAYVAAIAGYAPWIASVWGQDFNYYARQYLTHRHMTRWTLPRVPALTADCARDVRLAHEFGLPRTATTAVFPTNGGVDMQAFSPGEPIEARGPRIVYARGFGPYLRLENLLRALRDVQLPYILCLIGPSAQLPRLGQLAVSHGVPTNRIELHSYLDTASWVRILQSGRIMVSPSVSDGTPNAMLEAMACGALPVMGGIESIREWIQHGVNGLLFDSDDPQSIRVQIERALQDDHLFTESAAINRQIVADRADRQRVFPEIGEFYRQVVTRS
jgi:glycosyltransferase involved in cell wall biosynthesis